MKISLFTQFGALNSRPVFDAFSQGCQKHGLRVVENDTDAEIFVIWSVLWHGRMKANQKIWNLAKKTGKKIIILEVGGLIRGKTWRIGQGHVNNLGKFYHSENFDLGRPKKLGIFLKTREKYGQNILICGQHSQSEQWSTRPIPKLWLSDLVKKIKTHSDRKIIFRPHPRDYVWANSLTNLEIDIRIPRKISNSYDDFDHDKDFLDAWCVINPCSNTGIQAAIEGIPIFTDPDSLAYPVSNKSLEEIETAKVFDRHEWLIKLCHTEWTVDEIRQGLPLVRILSKT